MIPIGTEISVATPVITSVPTIAWAAPPPAPITPRADSVKKSPSKRADAALDDLVEQRDQRRSPRAPKAATIEKRHRAGPWPAARPRPRATRRRATGRATTAVHDDEQHDVKRPVAASAAATSGERAGDDGERRPRRAARRAAALRRRAVRARASGRLSVPTLPSTGASGRLITRARPC